MESYEDYKGRTAGMFTVHYDAYSFDRVNVYCVHNGHGLPVSRRVATEAEAMADRDRLQGEWDATHAPESVATVELETIVASDIVESVTLRVYGGKSHSERVAATDKYLAAIQEFNPPIVCNAYETTSKYDDSGKSYVEFRFFHF